MATRGNDPVAAKKDVNLNRFGGFKWITHQIDSKFLALWKRPNPDRKKENAGIHRSFLCLAKIGLAHVPLPEDAAGTGSF